MSVRVFLGLDQSAAPPSNARSLQEVAVSAAVDESDYIDPKEIFALFPDFMGPFVIVLQILSRRAAGRPSAAAS